MKTPYDRLDDKTIKAFTELIVQKMASLSSSWKQPWVNIQRRGFPENLSGRRYSNSNAFFLLLLCEAEKYEMPVFLTFLQAKENGLSIRKGEQSFPVIYHDFSVKHRETGEKIKYEQWKQLSDKEKELYKVSSFAGTHRVFNVEQTNIKEVKPELWEKLQNRFKVDIPSDTTNMATCPAMDLMLSNQGWLCPISLEKGDQAFYSLSHDTIHIPLKEQFIDGESFYATLAHEMSHSTGSKGRLNRLPSGPFDQEKYGREELVAEMTAVLVMASLGIAVVPREENIAYLKGWCEEIQKEPKFLFTILSDVNKASAMILDVTDKYQMVAQEMKETQEVPEFVQSENYVPANGKQLEFQFVENTDVVTHELLTRKLQERMAPISTPGDFCHVERIFEESKHFEFTSPSTVKTVEDVAYIFRNLEDASLENSFFVLVKDHIPVVLHVGMGNLSCVQPFFVPVKLAYDKLEADQVYFVHNHPSGRLKASREDIRYWQALKELFGEKLMPGIIINLKTGKYGLYSSSESSVEIANKNLSEEIPLKILSFSKQVFSPSYDPEKNFMITCSEDVASFISSHRLGDRKKISALIINNGSVVANVLTPYTEINGENADSMAQYLSRMISVMGGRSAILYGDFKLNAFLNTLADKIKRYSFGDFRLSDTVTIKGNHSTYISALNECCLHEAERTYVKKKEAAPQMEEFVKNRNADIGFTGNITTKSTNLFKMKQGLNGPLSDAEFQKEKGWTDEQFDTFKKAIMLVRAITGTEPSLAKKLMNAIKKEDFNLLYSLASYIEKGKDYQDAEKRYHNFCNTLPEIWEIKEKREPVEEANRIYFAMIRGDAHPSQLNQALEHAEEFIRNRNADIGLTGNITTKSTNYLNKMEPKFQEVDVSKINWEQLTVKFGITKEILEEKGVLDEMLNRKKSSALLKVNYQGANGAKEFDARVAFREKDGEITLQFYPVRQAPPFSQPYHGYTFSDEDKKVLEQTGHLGKVVEIQPYNQEKRQVLISLDPLTNDIVHLDLDKIKLPHELGHVALTDGQKEVLLKGEPVYMKDMTNREGKKFNAFVQIDADKRALSFIPSSKVLIENIPEVAGVQLTDEQKKMLKDGQVLSLQDLQSKDGRIFSAKVSYDAEEGKFKFDFPESKKIKFTNEQKKALDAGEKVLLTGFLSKSGKPYDMIVYKDKETGALKKEWPVKDEAFKVKLSDEQKKALQNGQSVFLDNLQRKNGTTFNAKIVWDAKEGKFGFEGRQEKEEQKEVAQQADKQQEGRKTGVKL